jgi:hypothetical protein
MMVGEHTHVPVVGEQTLGGVQQTGAAAVPQIVVPGGHAHWQVVGSSVCPSGQDVGVPGGHTHPGARDPQTFGGAQQTVPQFVLPGGHVH